jgi:hypothetical protein
MKKMKTRMKAAGSAAIAACVALGCVPERACPEDNIRGETQDVISDATHDGMSGATHDGMSGATTRLEENILEDRTYEITLPLKYNDGRPIGQAVHDAAAQRLSEHFGGVSRYNSTEGCWKDEEKDALVCEDNIIFSASRECGAGCTAEQHAADRKFIEDLAEEYCAKLGQSSIYMRESRVDAEFVEIFAEKKEKI